MFLLYLANIFFFVLHSIIILINLFGWMHPKTRNLSNIVLSLTAFSWLIIGYFYGWGYCFLTDYHYKILYQLGYENLPHSYIKMIIDWTFKTNSDPVIVDIITGTCFIFAVIGAITVSSINSFTNKSKN